MLLTPLGVDPKVQLEELPKYLLHSLARTASTGVQGVLTEKLELRIVFCGKSKRPVFLGTGFGLYTANLFGGSLQRVLNGYCQYHLSDISKPVEFEGVRWGKDGALRGNSHWLERGPCF